jgi:protein-tyrosine kinase
MMAPEKIVPMEPPEQPVEKIVPLAASEVKAVQVTRPVRSIGEILVEDGKLTAAGAQQVWNLHRRHGMRFGEAALQLDLVTRDDVRRALAKQYDFCYLEPGQNGVSREIVVAYEPYHQRVEEFRVLRTQLLIRWFGAETGRRTLAIVSAGQREGRSYVAANLAVVFAQLGHRTLLVDADMRCSRQHRLFSLPDRIGLSAVLSGRCALDAATRTPGMNGLWVLPAGPLPPNPQELLSRNAFAALLQHAEGNFDVVLVDTPPATLYADAQTVAFRAGAALMLVRKDRTRVADAAEVVRGLGDSTVRIVGTVINAF